MSRLIFIPQFPTELRYQEFFFWTFPEELKKHFNEVIVIGQNSNLFDSSIERDLAMFSPLNTSFKFELDQMDEYINLSLDRNDILLLNDISFPGLFANILYHKRPKKCFSYCHASSLNKYDYFEPDRYSKFKVETGISHLFDKVFVGSNYHKNKLGWDNTVVVGLPVPPFNGFKQQEKKYDIISVSRPTMQKVNKKLEKKVERYFGKIVRKTCNSWLEYYQFLSEAKIVLFTGKEDTFGYSIMEAIMNNSIPLAPDKCSYPELLPEEYLYSDIDELCIKISQVLEGELLPPKKLLCQDLCDNFYENIAKEMKENNDN